MFMLSFQTKQLSMGGLVKVSVTTNDKLLTIALPLTPTTDNAPIRSFLILEFKRMSSST